MAGIYVLGRSSLLGARRIGSFTHPYWTVCSAAIWKRSKGLLSVDHAGGYSPPLYPVASAIHLQGH
jgi:hypothetical protein